MSALAKIRARAKANGFKKGEGMDYTAAIKKASSELRSEGAFKHPKVHREKKSVHQMRAHALNLAQKKFEIKTGTYDPKHPPRHRAGQGGGKVTSRSKAHDKYAGVGALFG